MISGDLPSKIGIVAPLYKYQKILGQMLASLIFANYHKSYLRKGVNWVEISERGELERETRLSFFSFW